MANKKSKPYSIDGSKYSFEFNDDEKITFYFLKNDTLTNCQLEDINSYGMGIEFTIQDTSELFEEAA